MNLRRRLRLPLALSAMFLGGCMGSYGARAQAPTEVEAFLRQGDYDQAIDLLERRLDQAPSLDLTSQLADLLLLVGRFEDAESRLLDALASSPADGRIGLRYAQVLRDTGRLEEALDAFSRVEQEGGGGTARLARLHRGEILLRTGQPTAARALFEDFIDIYNQSANLNALELIAVAHAVRHLEATDSSLLQDALRAYDEALALDPDNLDAQVGIGLLFVRTYQTADARDVFRQVLERQPGYPPAFLGMGLAAQVEGSAQAGEFVDQALDINPNLVPALVLRARIRLAAEDPDGAEEDLSHALDIDPTSSEALGVLAASRYLQNLTDEFEELTERALGINPGDAGYFLTVADLVSTRRFYAEAADFADRGIRLDSLAWGAYGAKGLNQLRTGEIAEGRRNLEIAFEGDPYNLWFKNTLDLLDVMDTFEELGSDRISVLVDPEDGQALSLYLLEMAERAYDALSSRYDYRPPIPIRIEAFRRSADFSVRTVGLAGLGALGVAFGSVVAMDSPSARGTEGYHWASTLWHEMAHVVHLGMTGHRVPRWLSEGLAVHEERLAGPGWGARPGLPFFAAYEEEQLRPPSELSQSFVRPRFPEEVVFAYTLGSLVSEWIEAEWGFEGLRGMLEGYGEGLSHERVLARELGLDPQGFDRQFDAWMRERYDGAFAAAVAVIEVRNGEEAARSNPDWLQERVAQAPEDVESRLALARLWIEQERWAEAESLLIEAHNIFPDNPDPQGPSRLLAAIRKEQGDALGTIEALSAHLAVVAEDYAGQLEIGNLLEEQGDLMGASRALERAIQVYPFDMDVHTRLAAVYGELGDLGGAVRERQVVVALEPVDRTGALFELANALYRAGDTEGARSAVLGALELAPRFPEAQELLLLIMSEGTGGMDERG